MTKKFCYFFTMLIILISACNDHVSPLRMQFDISELTEKNISEFVFPKVGCIAKTRFFLEHEVRQLIEWLKTGKRINTYASYPNTINDAEVILSTGTRLKFQISTPSENVDYVVIKFNSKKLLAQKFPFCDREIEKI